MSSNCSLLFAVSLSSAFLSISSSKLYSLQIRLIFDIGVFEFKSILIIQPESFSIHLTISFVLRLFHEFIFSKSLKYLSKPESTPSKAFLNSKYSGLFLLAHHNWSVMDFSLFGSSFRYSQISFIFSFLAFVCLIVSKPSASRSISAIFGFLSRIAFGKADFNFASFSSALFDSIFCFCHSEISTLFLSVIKKA
jgi:hypothetical protein